MPTAYAAVEYMLATAKQAAEEVDDPVFAIANLADHSPDQNAMTSVSHRPSVSTSTASTKPATAPSVVLGWRTA